MDQIKTALEKGMSREQKRIINILVGITMASWLENADKRDCVNFIRDMEAYIDFKIGGTKEDFGSTWTPKLYGVYYYPDFEQPESVWRTMWTDTWTDNRIKNTVGIYKTKQQALDKAIKLGWLEEELK